MVSVDRRVDEILRRDVLRYIVHLKMLRAYPGAIRCTYTEDGASVGVLLLLETDASPFDAKTYASTRYVVLPAATDGSTGVTVIESRVTVAPSTWRVVLPLMPSRVAIMVVLPLATAVARPGSVSPVVFIVAVKLSELVQLAVAVKSVVELSE